MRLCASLLGGAAIVLNALLPSTAAAQSTFTTQSVNLRAGPDRSFPLVTWFPPRTQVRVLGCTAGWRWCDVSARGRRGWVSSRYLANVRAAVPRSSRSRSGPIGTPTFAIARGMRVGRAGSPGARRDSGRLLRLRGGHPPHGRLDRRRAPRAAPAIVLIFPYADSEMSLLISEPSRCAAGASVVCRADRRRCLRCRAGRSCRFQDTSSGSESRGPSMPQPPPIAPDGAPSEAR